MVGTLVLTACADGKKMGFVTPTPEGTQINPTKTLPTEAPTPFVEPGRILDLEKDSNLLTTEIKKEFENFDVSHSELEGRDVYKFAIQGPTGPIGFATYQLEADEIEIAIIAQSEDGKTAISIPDRALYVTTKDMTTGEYSWTRLLGVALPGEGEDTKIVTWYYLPEGYPRPDETTLLALDYPILNYQLPDNGVLLFWEPAIVDGKPAWAGEPNAALVASYNTLPEGAKKVLFSLLPVEPTITATEWQVVGKDYLVSIGENNVPEYRFVEGEGWQEVEQISMVDAFGNTVPGWVVEKSDEWEGEISQTSKLLIGGRYNPVSETSLAIISSATLKQWQLMEFINSDGVKMQKLNFTWIFKNDENKVITVKVGMPELNYGARIEKLTPRQFMDSLVVGGQTEFLVFIWVDTLSAMTPEKRAEFFTGYARDGELCKQSVQACGLSIGRMGEVKHPTSWFDDIYHGLYGDNIDIANEAWCQRPVK